MCREWMLRLLEIAGRGVQTNVIEGPIGVALTHSYLCVAILLNCAPKIRFNLPLSAFVSTLHFYHRHSSLPQSPFRY